MKSNFVMIIPIIIIIFMIYQIVLFYWEGSLKTGITFAKTLEDKIHFREEIKIHCRLDVLYYMELNDFCRDYIGSFWDTIKNEGKVFK